jgi:hypothetical protein
VQNVSNIIFSQNIAQLKGGTISLSSKSILKYLSNVTISNSSAELGGAIFIED